MEKKSTNYGTTKSISLIDAAKDVCSVPDSWKVFKQSLKQTISKDRQEYWTNYIIPLVKQGSLLRLLEIEKSDLTWKSFCFNMPKNLLSFAIRSSIDCLPTPDNLSLWGKRTSDKCKLWNNRGSLSHLLNSCPVALEQGRFTYRHNSVLQYLVKRISEFCKTNVSDTSFYADLPGYKINGGTVPPTIVPTSEKPDLVIHNKVTNTVYLCELTVPFEINIETARGRKLERYTQLASDIRMNGYKCDLSCFEIGSRDIITKKIKASCVKFLKFLKKERSSNILVKYLK